MLAIFVLSLLIFTQTILASASDDDWLNLRDPSRLLEAEKRYADKNAASMRAKKTIPDTPDFVLECVQPPIDLGLIIDSSRSIGPGDYKSGQQFLANFLDYFDIGPGTDQTRVAAVSFGNGVYKEIGFNFTSFDDKELVKEKVRTMPYQSGGETRTTEALKYMREVQMQMRRASVKQVQLVLTDGRPTNPWTMPEQAEKTKDSNITVFALGVGRRVLDSELLKIAGGVKEHVFTVLRYDDLGDEIIDAITERTCTTPPTPTTPVPTTPAPQPPPPTTPVPTTPAPPTPTTPVPTTPAPPLKKTTPDTPNITVCIQRPIDLGLIIDSSRSIRSVDYKAGQQFLANLLDDFNIGPETNQTRVAAVTFGKGVYTNNGFNFTSFDDKEEVKKAVLGIPFSAADATDTAHALKYMREVQMQMRRASVKQFQLVLTDGKSNSRRDTKREASETKMSNITVFALGVGSNVDKWELFDIAGGVKENIFEATSYDSLNQDFIERILQRTCITVPSPTTPVPTTPVPQPVPSPTTPVPTTPVPQPCGRVFPTDINFIFSAATMGLEETMYVTSFIWILITLEDLSEGFQFGVVSGDCPDDEGFRLNQYNSTSAMAQHMERYKRDNLPNVIQRATDTRFTPESGARANARKVAVIFLGNIMVKKNELVNAMKRMVASGVLVFVCGPDINMNALASDLPIGVIRLEGESFKPVANLLNFLCVEAK